MAQQMPWNEQIPGQDKYPLRLNLPGLLGPLARLRANTPAPAPVQMPPPLAELMRNPRNLFGVQPPVPPPGPTPTAAATPPSAPTAEPSGSLADLMRGTPKYSGDLPADTGMTGVLSQPTPPSAGPLADFLTKNKPPELHGGKLALDIAGRILAPGIEREIPGTPGNYERRRGLAVQQQGEFEKGQQSAADVRQKQALAEQEEAKAYELRHPKPAPIPREAPPETQAYDELVESGVPALDAFGQVELKKQRPPSTRSNPFEAFAYGTPQERQAAQEFIRFEKQIGKQYDKPGEIEQRYALYQRDPEAYKAMFGDRGSAQGQANATRMLNYFDKRRREISQDWTLDEQTKAQQLAEIDQLAQPYLNPSGAGQGEDRVTVISPKGIQGTIPRSQLKAAQQKGYKVAQ